MKLKLSEIQPYIRYVNHYEPSCSYTEQERIIYDYELMYVMDGAVDIYYEGKLYHLKKSDIFYFRPFDRNFMIVDYSKHFRTHCIHFDWIRQEEKYDFSAEEFYLHSVFSAEHREKLMLLQTRPQGEPEDFVLPTQIQGLSYEKYSSLFSECYYRFLQCSPAARLRLRSLFLEIVSELYSDIADGEYETIVHPKIRRAMQYMTENYSDSITVSALAGKYDLSPKYFGVLFKSSVGMSISEFLLGLRMAAAKEMLCETRMSVGEIAERTGFQNAFYFSKCFRRREKLSPMEYRHKAAEWRLK